MGWAGWEEGERARTVGGEPEERGRAVYVVGRGSVGVGEEARCVVERVGRNEEVVTAVAREEVGRRRWLGERMILGGRECRWVFAR